MTSDPYQNARPYYDVTFPSSGDGFSIAGTKNALQGLGFLDHIPLQPRAHSPADTKIMVRGRDASGFFNPVYAGDADQHVFFNSGDSPAFSAPVSNPRVDIVYITPSGDIRVVTGTEAASPTLPSLSPSGDTRVPVCAVWNKPSQTKIVNFEDRTSNTGDGYIYQDLRPWLRAHSMGGVSLTAVTPSSATGDNSVGTVATAAKGDHHHQGVHTVRLAGSGDLFGDVEFQGPFTQQGNRLTAVIASQAQMENAADNNILVTPKNMNWHPCMPKAFCVFNGTLTGTNAPAAGFNVASVQRSGTGEYIITFNTPFSSTNYGFSGNALDAGINTGSYVCLKNGTAPGTGSLTVNVGRSDTGALTDVNYVSLIFYGDQ